MNNLKDLETTIEKNAHLSFDEYRAIREPAINAVINDYAAKIVENNPEITLAEAKEIAKTEIPTAFVPEWMKNLRISANIAGTELCYLEALNGTLSRIEELLNIVFEKPIEKYLTRAAQSIRREASEEVNNNE
jgi:hypothetical protein